MEEETLRRKLSQLQRGDRKVFEEIYEELKVPVFTIALRITNDRGIAEDITQDVFVRLFQSPPGENVRNPRAYIFQMARNLAIDSVRKQTPWVNMEETAEYVGNLRQEEEDIAVKIDVKDALSSLSLADRQIVTLHINGGLKFREIAGIMGMPLGTILWRHNQAIGRLRKILDTD